MKSEMDKIRFESKRELQDLMEVVVKYVDAYPKEKNNETLKRFYDLLDVMEMTW